MKKRGIFSLVMLLALSMTMVFATDYADLGTAGELVVTGQALYESQQNTASTVTVITAEEIEQTKPASTAELVGQALGTGFSSYGALGALQNVQIRGSSSAQVDIYVDGIKMNSAHDGNFDLSLIPVSAIDHIEIVRSGTGSAGNSNAIGGMVYISTKKGKKTDKPFRVSFENGGFLPETYLDDSDEAQRNWLGLVDSQKADISYANTFDKLTLGVSAGAQVAQNNYTYWYSQETTTSYPPPDYDPTTGPDPKYDSIRLRENARMWTAYGSMNASYAFNDTASVSLSNMTNYKSLGLPGGLSYLSETDYQNDMFTTSSLQFSQKELFEGLLDIDIHTGYTFDQTFYHGYSDSTHDKHQTQSSVEAKWNLSDKANASTGLSFDWDHVDSTDVGIHDRYNPNLYATGSVYFLDGALSIHPMARIGWTNDFGFTPTASLGVIGIPIENLQLSANISYAKTNPTFSDMYWPYSDYGSSSYEGNPDLKPERAISGEIIIAYDRGPISYEGSAFARNMYDQIQVIYNGTAGKTQNIKYTFFAGTEQSLTVTPVEELKLSASYLLNYSWDLSGANTFASDIRVGNVRMHTVKFSAGYGFGIGDVTLSGQYLGASSSAKAAFLLDAVMNFDLYDDYSVYVAVDNLLNTRYELVTGYPMPGTKIRIGASAKF